METTKRVCVECHVEFTPATSDPRKLPWCDYCNAYFEGETRLAMCREDDCGGGDNATCYPICLKHLL